MIPVNELKASRLNQADVIVTGGRSEIVFAIDTRSGGVNWQLPTRGQLLEPIAVIGKDVYAPTSTGILHAIGLDKGDERWTASNVKRFVAASQKRVYVLDTRNRLLCLDRATGATMFVYDIRRFDHCYFNLETDQIFLLTNGGLIQCLRERQFVDEKSTSLRHRLSSEEFANAIKEGKLPKLWWVEKDTDVEDVDLENE